MLASVRNRLIAAASAAVVAAGLTAFTTGGVGDLMATVCGPYDGKKCWENESCVRFLFYSQCTTEYKYYSGDTELLA